MQVQEIVASGYIVGEGLCQRERLARQLEFVQLKSSLAVCSVSHEDGCVRFIKRLP